jgi:DNA-binding LacI/PurR family transcriptional regulator
LIANWVDGFMIAPSLEGEKTLAAITQSGIPFILMDRLISENVDYVAIDNYAATYTGVKYLLEQGHRQIAYIGWNVDLNTMVDRNKAFFKAVEEFGVDRENIFFRRCPRTPEAGYNTANKILDEHRPTAFFIDQNNIAEGVVQALRRRKIKIPEDVSVLLYGDPSWARLNVPEFTCVALPDIEIGAESARILIDRVEGRSSGIQTILLGGSLIERGSISKLI